MNIYKKKYRKAAIEHLGGRCESCFTTDNLEFDHIDPKSKEFCIGGNLGKLSNPRFIKELAKCQLLCHNCHKDKTYIDKGLESKHGTPSMYSNHSCRCTDCTEAWRVYRFPRQKKWRENKALISIGG